MCMIWVFPIQSPFHKNTESSLIFLRNDVLIHNGKENKESRAICFEIRIPKKKNKELLWKVPSNIYEVILFWKKKRKKKLWFVNISKYHHRTMGLVPTREGIRIPKFQKYGSSISLNTENVLYRNFNTIEFRKSQY